MTRHRDQEFIRFLDALESSIPVGKGVHAILDSEAGKKMIRRIIFPPNATHKHAAVRDWLVRHPRWTFHFTPTSSSWLDSVEGFFAKLTRRRLKCGVFRSVPDLKDAIDRFFAEHNKTAKPFIWRADSDKIIAARNRGFQMLEAIH